VQNPAEGRAFESNVSKMKIDIVKVRTSEERGGRLLRMQNLEHLGFPNKNCGTSSLLGGRGKTERRSIWKKSIYNRGRRKGHLTRLDGMLESGLAVL